jgi:hypothetical protein
MLYIAGNLITNIPIGFENLGKDTKDTKVDPKHPETEHVTKAHGSFLSEEAQKARGPHKDDKDHKDGDHPDEEEFWTCPMHAQVMHKEPGTCPICGMTLTSTVEHNLAVKPVDYIAQPLVSSSSSDIMAMIGADGCSIDLFPNQPAREGATANIWAMFSNETDCTVGPIAVTVTFSADKLAWGYGYFNMSAITTRSFPAHVGETEAQMKDREAQEAADLSAANLKEAEMELAHAKAIDDAAQAHVKSTHATVEAETKAAEDHKDDKNDKHDVKSDKQDEAKKSDDHKDDKNDKHDVKSDKQDEAKKSDDHKDDKKPDDHKDDKKPELTLSGTVTGMVKGVVS